MAIKNQTHIRVFPEDKLKVNDIKFTLEAIEKRKVSDAELARRIFNIPNLKPVLIRDSEIKRRLSYGK